jgi:hypothetical protein
MRTPPASSLVTHGVKTNHGSTLRTVTRARRALHSIFAIHPPPSLETQFQTLVGRHEAEPLVEADGVRARLVGGELDDAAPVLARAVDGPLDQLPPDTGRTPSISARQLP